MINRLQHYVNGLEVVPVNRDEFTLTVDFNDQLGEWQNNFSSGNKLILSHEGYVNVISHVKNIGIHQQIPYNLHVNNITNKFYLDVFNGININGHFVEIDIKNFISKDNIKDNIKSLTFEYLFQKGFIKSSDMINIPYVVIPQDAGAKILNISIMMFVLTKDLIDRGVRVSERIGDLIAGTLPQPAPPTVAFPIGLTIRYSLLIVADITLMLLSILAMIKLVKNAFDLLLPPLRNFNAMTVDRLLTIGLGYYGIAYSSMLSSEFKKLTVLPVPIDEKKKKFFEMILSEDTRMLNRGYPTASDTIPTVGMLIDELCKIYNIQPVIVNNTLILNPKGFTNSPVTCVLDYNFNTDKKTMAFKIDTFKMWNTKIIRYVIDPSDKMLFDNPKGSSVELKTVVKNVPTDELTVIKGLEEVNINFALGVIKQDTKFENFLKNLAVTSDKLLNTSFQSKLNKRNGVLALTQEQFSTTKILYQTSGKQTSDYISKIGAVALYANYHIIDDSVNSCFEVYSDAPTRMNNEQFLNVLQNKIVNLEGKMVELTSVSYTPENSHATIGYKIRTHDYTKNLKTEIVYAE